MEKGTEFEEFEEMNYYWVSYLIIVLEYILYTFYYHRIVLNILFYIYML